MSPLVIDPSLDKEARDTTPQEQVNLTENLRYFEECQEHRELLKSIEVVIPVRPEDGMNCHLSRRLAIWYGEGTPWCQINDNCGGFIEMTRANIAYNFVHKPYQGPKPNYLLMIDNDMEPPMNLPYLLGRHDKPIVGGVAVHIHPKVGPRACFTVPSSDGELRWPQMRKHKLPASGLLRVGHLGTGAIMIRRDVLEAFTFRGNEILEMIRDCVVNDKGLTLSAAEVKELKNADVPFYVPEDVRVAGATIGRLTLGEDLAFSEQCKAKGFDSYVDLEAHCGHRKTLSMSWDQSCIDPGLSVEGFELPDSDGGVVGE